MSAAGPWVDELREINKSKKGKRLHLTKGVHIVVPHTKVPVRQAIYFDVIDGRMIFAIPRGRATYIGTTDTNYDSDKDNVVTTRDDAQYLVDAVNATFPSVHLEIQDIESSWAGLRPLIHEEGKSASELSRKDEIFESTTGLISIAGGKLTGYRKMAERVVSLVIKRHFNDRSFDPCVTDEIKLATNTFHGSRDVRKFQKHVEEKLGQYAIPELTVRYLVENYGQQTDDILKYAGKLENATAEIALLKAELWFCIHHEMVCTLQDFFVRRTGLIHFDIAKVKKYKEVIAEDFKMYLAWSDERNSEELATLDRLIYSLQNFK